MEEEPLAKVADAIRESLAVVMTEPN